MQNFVAETMPLLPTKPSASFFQKSINSVKNITCKTVTIASVSAMSVVTYYAPSYQAGASVAKELKEIAAASGLGTNFLFNNQAYQELLDQFPKLIKMPWQLSAAIFFSTMCVAPNLFMNIIDEEGNYIDEPNMILQIISAFLNIGVNVVGSMNLINSISSLLKNKIDIQKEKLIQEINLVIEQFAKTKKLDSNHRLNTQSQDELINLLTANNDLSLQKKISYYSLNIILGLFSIPQFTAYLLISYFGMRDLADKKFGTTNLISILLGLVAAIGNGIPGAGFSIKGVNSTSKKLMSLEKPSLFTIFSALFVSFSGFTTHKAMADSLKKLGYSGDIAKALKWTANLGAALIFNLPQATGSDASAISNQLNDLKGKLEDQVKNFDSSNIQNFKTDLPNIVSSFFTANVRENIALHEYPQSFANINSV